MSNGVSCAISAYRNAKSAKKHKNIFKAGVAIGQTCRTIDAAMQLSFISNTIGEKATTISGGIANTCDKILYPLRISSCIAQTIKSEDKVKTGFSSIIGILTMYLSEKIIGTQLKKFYQKINKLPNTKLNISLKTIRCIMQGTIYSASGILGHDIGCKITEKIITNHRQRKNEKILDKAIQNYIKLYEKTKYDIFFDID